MTVSSTVRGSGINITQAGGLSTLNMNKFVPVLRKLGGKLPDLYAEGSHIPTSYPDIITLNLQNIKDNHADQPVETHATPLSKVGGKLPDLYAEGSHVPTSYPDTTTLNLQNIKDKHADQHVETHATPYRIHLLPLLNS